jgi:hypothetical protein
VKDIDAPPKTKRSVIGHSVHRICYEASYENNRQIVRDLRRIVKPEHFAEIRKCLAGSIAKSLLKKEGSWMLVGTYLLTIACKLFLANPLN